MKYTYYYNNVPEIGKVRNNLVYTSLISEDRKKFVQWYYNDTEYHEGMNQVVDPSLMTIKWNREVRFLELMGLHYPDLVPVYEINEIEKKVYLKIDGPDFWECSGCSVENYDKVLPDWQEQMLEILRAHKNLRIWKYSLHPSSYFVVDGKLKSINYFFTYSDDEPMISVQEHRSHISEGRQKELESKMKFFGIDWNTKVPFKDLQILCFESFRNNYPDEFIERAKSIFLG